MRNMKKETILWVMLLFFVAGSLTGHSEPEAAMVENAVSAAKDEQRAFDERTGTPLDQLEARIAAQEERLRLLQDELEKLRNERERQDHDERFPQKEKPLAPEKQYGSAGVQNNRFFIQSADEINRMTIGGRIQPRFEHVQREDRDNLTRFRFRRVRLDVRGHVIDENLTFRIMPELRDRAELDTAWINYRFSDRFQLRAGQYSVPFSWERDVSSSRHQLTERSVANNAFQWPGGGGKDLGVMLHGNSPGNIRYATGVFGGEGKNRSGGSSEGVLLSGRVAWSPVGNHPNTETLLKPLEKPNLSFGAGAWYANRNAVRDWAPQVAGDQRADAYATTADGHLQVGRFSMHISGFYRRVEPEANVPAYDGSGFTLQGGYLFLPDRLFASLRYSESEANKKQFGNRKREVLGGVQIFHQGHHSKVHLETGWEQDRDGDQRRDAQIVRVQYQLLF